MITNINQLDTNREYSYADYLMWQFDERVELIKGMILRMSPAPSTRHQKISNFLSSRVTWFLKDASCSVFTAPFDVRLPVSVDLKISKKYKTKAKELSDGMIMTVVQPDICVICDESKLDERGCIGAPDIIIEILSPGNTQREMKDKFGIYQEAGVQEYWIVEPMSEFIIIYALDKNIYIGSRPYTAGDTITSKVLPGLEINVSEVFSK